MQDIIWVTSDTITSNDTLLCRSKQTRTYIQCLSKALKNQQHKSFLLKVLSLPMVCVESYLVAIPPTIQYLHFTRLAVRPKDRLFRINALQMLVILSAFLPFKFHPLSPHTSLLQLLSCSCSFFYHLNHFTPALVPYLTSKFYLVKFTHNRGSTVIKILTLSPFNKLTFKPNTLTNNKIEASASPLYYQLQDIYG